MGMLGRAATSAAGICAAPLLAQRGHLIGWVPVCLAIGIGLYFALRFEPGAGTYAVVGLIGLSCAAGARLLPEGWAPLALGGLLVATGIGIAGTRAHLVAAPVLDWRYYGPVEGRVVGMDRSQSDALRLTLDQVALNRVPPARTPARVRLSLHGGPGIDPLPGMRVMTTAHLAPPSGAVEPGGFDFKRHAWFGRLGAVGYTRVPLVGATPPEPDGWRLRVFTLRMALSTQIQARLPADLGGFAAAITTGDRSWISQPALEALRASNLAHLLAISGLHMGLLSGFVFAAVRLALVLVPGVALFWPTKKIAAAAALVAALAYLALSGGNVATERAFIMVAVALCAVMLGRRALSLRAVAIAATLVLVLRPEALLGPGFQMSFAATTALVAVFGALRDLEQRWLPRWARPVAGVVVSSLVAGLATAPIAAAHFNTIAHYGLIANVISVPLMGVLVIPAAVAALLLVPLGLEGLGLWAMGAGLRWILGVAQTIAGWEGARGYVVAPGPAVLPIFAFGALVLVLWHGRGRWLGLPVMLLAAGLWQGAVRPMVLIADTGGLVGVMTPEGRALSRAKGAGFIARSWLENDGEGAGQADAAARWEEGAIVHLSGKRAVADAKGCGPAQIVVASVPADRLKAPGCRVFDPPTLRHTGAIALFPQAEGWRSLTDRQLTGTRLWRRWPD